MDIPKASLICALICTQLSLATAAQADDSRAQAIRLIKADFSAQGIAGVDRLEEDGLQAVCNRSGNKPPQAIARRLEQDQQAGIRYPADGKFLGDWRSGEKIAQSGSGFTWTDPSGVPAGGNCYNCHRLAPQELAFGSLGPALTGYGKTFGNTAEVQKYVYGKIYNAKATRLCSVMPRFGHVGALNEQQIKDLVALLLDPASPVNK